MSRSKSKKYNSSRKEPSRTAQSYMPLYVILGGFALVAAGLFALWKVEQPVPVTVPIEVKGQPSLKVDQEQLDFGDVKLDKTVTASFTLSNVGDKTLSITAKPYIEVKEGC